jgi:hypothetical protein
MLGMALGIGELISMMVLRLVLLKMMSVKLIQLARVGQSSQKAEILHELVRQCQQWISA